MDIKKRFLFILLMLMPIYSMAETVYVTDILKLKLRASTGTDAQVITNLSSGDKLTVVEKQKRYTRVKTSDGRTGWVQSWFLTDKIPAAHKVDNLIREKETLVKQLLRAESKLKNFDSETAKENDQLRNTVATLSRKIERLTATRRDLEYKLEQQSGELAKYALAEKYNINLIILVLFLISFSGGFLSAYIFKRFKEKKRLWGYQLAY